MRVVVLAGGTGGAMLAQGFHEVLEPGALGVICNTADDIRWHGLLVSPDVDAVLYRLAGIFDEERRFGIAGDTFTVMAQLESLGAETWFRLGDRDLAICVHRTASIGAGSTLSEAVAELCKRFGIRSTVLPMSDITVKTLLTTDRGEREIQQWLVRDHQEPAVLGVRLDPAEPTPAPGAIELIAGAELVVIGPSNPAISIEPILATLGDRLQPDRTLAVTPIVAGKALKGPTIEMLRTLGREATAVGVAAGYARYAGRFVLDVRDAHEAGAIRALGYADVAPLDTVMGGADGRRRLARDILGLG
jgi:LPPG:FO 2-phospho-L-lactate transferase